MKHTRTFTMDDEVFKILKQLANSFFTSYSAMLSRLIIEQKERVDEKEKKKKI